MVAECLRDAGWNPRIEPDGSVNVEVPQGQEEQFETANKNCWSLVEMRTFDDYSHEERLDVYDGFLDLRHCIIEQGVDLPAAPSFQAWVDMNGVWSPYADVPRDVFMGVGQELLKECPQSTP